MAISKDFVVKNGLQVALASTFSNTLVVTGNASFSNDVTISGNLTVTGTTTYVNTATLNISDNIITLNADVSGATAPSENAGMEINRGSSANVQLRWNETTDSWEQSNAGISVFYKLLANADIVDSVVSTSITSVAAANSVKTAYDYAASQAATAYSNGVTYSSSATNLTTGTLNTARLPAQVNVSANVNIGANVTITTTQYGITGTTTIPTMSLNTAALVIGNSSVTGAPTINLANSVGNTTINANGMSSSWGLTANSLGVYHTGLVNSATSFVSTSANVGGNVQITTSAMTLGADAGTATNTIKVANSLGNTVIAATSITGSGWNFVANSLGVYHTGLVNSATSFVSTSANVGGNVQITTSAITLGTDAGTATNSIKVANSLGNTVITATSITGSGWNFIANASGVYHGGATGVVNAFTLSSGATFTANGSLVNAQAINVVNRVNTATVFASSTANVGANVQVTTSQYGITGTTTIPTMTLNTSALVIGNSSVTGAPTINLANSAGNTTVNTTSVGTSWGLTANSLGVYHSGTVNAFSHTVGTSFIANSSTVIVAQTAVITGGGATAEGGQIVLGYGNNLATGIIGQANNTFNFDVIGGNTGSTPLLRAFFQHNDATTTTVFNLANTGRMHVGSSAEQTDSTFKVTGTANVTANANFGSGKLFADAVNSRVGINTAAPTQAFEAVLGTTGIASFTDAGGNGRLWLAGNSQGSFVYNRDNSPLLIATANTERMRIDAGGNTSIGTTSTSYRFSVSTTASDVATFSGTTAAQFAQILVSSNDRSFISGVRSSTNTSGEQAFLYTSTATPIAFWTNATEKMRVASNGFVGIANTSPTAKLHVQGDDTALSLLVHGLTRGTRFTSNTTSSIIEGVDNVGTTLQALNIGGANVGFTASGTQKAYIDASGLNVTANLIATSANTALAAYTEKMTSLSIGVASTTDLDLRISSVFKIAYTSTTGTANIRFINPPASGTAVSATLIIQYGLGAGGSIALQGNTSGGAAGNTKYSYDTTPTFTLTNNRTDILSVMTYDGGATYIVSPSFMNFTTTP